LAQATGLLANDPAEVANAIKDLDDVVGKVKTFVADNRESIGTTGDKLTAVSQTLHHSLDDIKQTLHVLPNTLANGVNLYQPAQGTLTGIAALNNFADPITFMCGAIQAASRLGAEQSAKLCVQYLAPIVKNRQFNFPPIGLNPFVGATVRPNEITYSEDRLRPDYAPPQHDPAVSTGATGDDSPPLTAEVSTAGPAPSAVPTDPSKGLLGMMSPQGAPS
jgi:phospholipid/cholesterol/gamma-HCH transport system substrate-binding protein